MKYTYYKRRNCGETIWRWCEKESVMWIRSFYDESWEQSGCSPFMFVEELGGVSFTNFKKAIKHTFK
jgi:hypothetical protein